MKRQKKRFPKIKKPIDWFVFIAGLCMSVFCFCGSFLFAFMLPDIEREDAVETSAVYLYCEKHGGGRRHRTKYKLYFENNIVYDIENTDTQHWDQLQAVPRGTQMKLLLHPKNNIILEATAGDTVLYDFETTLARARDEYYQDHMLSLFSAIVLFVAVALKYLKR